jgi:hypothetical protein
MNTSSSFQTVVELFRRNQWNFQADDGRQVLRSSFKIKNGTVDSVVAVDNSDDLIQVGVHLPFVVPPERRLAAAELCLRLSANLKVGRFDLNFETGLLRFHAFSLYPKDELKSEVIQRLLGVSLAVLDHYFQAFTATLYAHALPAVAALQAGVPQGQAPRRPTHPPLEPRPRFNLN